jgi:hypothetical protein
MNERIEKLIEQCTVQNFSDCTGGFETFDKQKFARLIVQECIGVADHSNVTGKSIIGDRIKEYFGVEE